MILALPRSRTAWLANFLTTEKTFCYHDPLANMWSYRDVSSLKMDRITGVADTGLALFDLSIFDCKKLIIERSLNDVYASLDKFLPEVDLSNLNEKLYRIEGLRIGFDEINERLEEIWDYCTGLPFDALRADQLKNMNVQVMNLPIDINKIESLRAEIDA